MRIVSHTPFRGIKEAIEKHVDIESSSEFFETNGTRVLILDTDIGKISVIQFMTCLSY